MKHIPISPRLLKREQAAYYIGVSSSTFDRLVYENKMPPPKEVTSKRIVWDVNQIDMAIEDLPIKKETTDGNSFI